MDADRCDAMARALNAMMGWTEEERRCFNQAALQRQERELDELQNEMDDYRKEMGQWMRSLWS